MPAAAKAYISYDPSYISLFRPPTVSARANGVTEKREHLRRFRVPCHHTYLLGKHAAPVSSSYRANPFRNPSPLHILPSSKFQCRPVLVYCDHLNALNAFDAGSDPAPRTLHDAGSRGNAGLPV